MLNFFLLNFVKNCIFFFFFVELDLNLEKAHFNKFWDILLNLSFMCIIEFLESVKLFLIFLKPLHILSCF
jgi:hypothetical protein